MLQAFIERIRAAHADAVPLVIRGHGSKTFYGNPVSGALLDISLLSGVVDYQPKELVLTARAGATLVEIEALLSAHGQWLPFEPPQFDGRGTLGGAIASGLSGPHRAHAGRARDFVLGVQVIDGTGQLLRFGGRVIKNVAGYDLSRLMVGALGTLGLLTEVTLKVSPRPAAEISLRFECDEAKAIGWMNAWAARAVPLSGTSWHTGELVVRLSGAASAVQAARAKLGGEVVADADHYWRSLRDQRDPFFAARPLWRLALRSTTPPLRLPGATWIEAAGGIRWLATDAPADLLRNVAREHAGHATLFRGDPLQDGNFMPLAPALARLHHGLRQRFDPRGVFNRGRLFPES